jgi:polyhydroxybutyrate depolymerase
MKKVLLLTGIIILILFSLGTIKKIKENRSNQITGYNEPINQPNKPSGNSLKPGDYKFTLQQDKTERYYLIHIPKSYNENSNQLVLAFHGGMGTAEIQRDYYDWVEKSDKEGFAVAFPNGASRFDSGKIATWNAGNCCAYAVESNSDDVEFIKSLIDDIKEKLSIDKIFATGMSNGGMFSHRLACEMSDVFTAIGAVSGTNNYDSCDPESPISVMHIHGLLDDHVLFDGGCGPACKIKAETEFTSVPNTISDWVKKNNCNNNPERVLKNENGYCDLYSKCDDNVQVKLCVAKDGGHSWPGTTLSPSPNALEKDPPSQAFSATDLIWDFFMKQ